MSEQILNMKKENVEEIKGKIEKAQSIMLVDYRGLSVSEVTTLREKYREANVDYKVYKNTMLRFAFKDMGLEDFNEFLVGPSAVAFGYDDPVQAAKITADFAKDFKNLEIKAGVVDGKVIGLDEIKDLASLPPREVLIAQVVGGFNAPIQGFANVLNGTITSLVRVLGAIADEKQAV
ncbi:MAG TPA: 50S ribosomal protein L10 [Tissierellaceae bacterium]